MKKAIAFITVLILLLTSLTGTVDAQTNSSKPPIKLQILGRDITADSPTLVDSVVYLPFRITAEALGYKVTWYAKSQTMEVSKKDHSAKITIGSKTAYINKDKTTLDVNPIMHNGRAFVPFSFIEKNFAYNVSYDGKKNQITIGEKSVVAVIDENRQDKLVFVNDKKVDGGTLPVVINEKVYVPARAVVEALGYKVAWIASESAMELTKDTAKISIPINSKNVVVNGKVSAQDDPAVLYEGKTHIPLSYAQKLLNCDVEYDKTKQIARVKERKVNNSDTAAEVNITDIVFDESTGFPTIKIVADAPFEYTTFTLSNPERFIIDIQNAVVKTDGKDVSKGSIQRVRIAQNSISPVKVARIVVDLNSQKTCRVVPAEDKKTLSLVYPNIIKPITVGKEGNQDVITITGTDSSSTSVMKLDNPERLVVDIKAGVHEATDQTINVNSELLNAVRTGQFDASTARVVLDIKPDIYYYIENKNNETKIFLSSIPYDFFQYRKYYNYAYVDVNPNLEVEYQAELDQENNILKIAIAKDISVVEKRFEVNDNVVEYMEVKKETVNKSVQTIVLFKMKQKVTYELLSPSAARLVKLKFKTNPQGFGDLTVVIDAGHGGKDPGAVAKDSTKEKDLNLDVALRLNEKLKAIGFKTIMVRTDDTFYDLASRTELANTNYADFYMSIHYNSFNATTKGIETLYFPNIVTAENDLDNKKMAEIFHNETINALGLSSRGITPRPNLYVLNKTKMPAILSELGFLSNPEELQKVKTEEYREMSAKALAASIVKYFRDMQKLDFGFDIQSIYNDTLQQKVNATMR